VAPLSLALVSTAFPPERRGWAMGVYGGITGIAVLGGAVIGGAVTQGLAWQWVFWINVPIGLATIPLVLTHVPESYGPRARLDVPGLALVAIAAIGVVWGLMRGNDAGWGSVEVVGSLAAGVAALVAFVRVERGASAPMLPPRMFARRGFSAGTASNFLFSASLFSAVFFMAQFQQISLGQGPLDSGLRLLPWTATLFVVAPIAGALTNRVGERRLVTLGLAMQAAGMGWIALIAHPGMTYWHMIAPMVIAGAGISMAIPSAQSAVMNAVAAADLGKASGVYMTTRQLGGVFGLAIAVAVFTGAGSYASPEAFGKGFVPALTVAAALSLAGAVVAALLPRHTPQMEVSAQPLRTPATRSSGPLPALPDPIK
ncbi:MAG: MFS transporter, partial [Solirubrobacteraceae bacterium]